MWCPSRSVFTCRSSAVAETGVDGQLPDQAFTGLEQSAAHQYGPWTPELHACFVDCVNYLGGPALATPIYIFALMPEKRVTAIQIKAHLQLYRQHMAR